MQINIKPGRYVEAQHIGSSPGEVYRASAQLSADNIVLVCVQDHMNEEPIPGRVMNMTIPDFADWVDSLVRFRASIMTGADLVNRDNRNREIDRDGMYVYASCAAIASGVLYVGPVMYRTNAAPARYLQSNFEVTLPGGTTVKLKDADVSAAAIEDPELRSQIQEFNASLTREVKRALGVTPRAGCCTPQLCATCGPDCGGRNGDSKLRKVNEHEREALALYVVAARDPSDFVDAIQEPTMAIEVLVILERMLANPGTKATDCGLNELLLGPVRREIGKRPKLGINQALRLDPVFERIDHGLVTGDGPVQVPGPMPAAGTVGTTYHVSEVTDDGFKLTTTPDPHAETPEEARMFAAASMAPRARVPWTLPADFDIDKANAQLREQFKNPLPLVTVAPQTPEQRAARKVGPITITLAGDYMCDNLDPKKCSGCLAFRAKLEDAPPIARWYGETPRPLDNPADYTAWQRAQAELKPEDRTPWVGASDRECPRCEQPVGDRHEDDPRSHACSALDVETHIIRAWSPTRTEECPVEDTLRGGFTESDAQLRARLAPFRMPHGDVTHADIKRATPQELLRGSYLSSSVAQYNVEQCKAMIAKLGEDHPQIVEYRRMLMNGTLIAPELAVAFQRPVEDLPRDAFRFSTDIDDALSQHVVAEGARGYQAHGPNPEPHAVDLKPYAVEVAARALREVPHVTRHSSDHELRAAALDYARVVLSVEAKNWDPGEYRDAIADLERIAARILKEGE